MLGRKRKPDPERDVDWGTSRSTSNEGPPVSSSAVGDLVERCLVCGKPVRSDQVSCCGRSLDD